MTARVTWFSLLTVAPLAYDEAGPVRRSLRRFAAAGPGSWLFARLGPQVDRPVHRLTRGRHTFASLLTGVPVVMLTTTGAKSGEPRTTPVLGIPTGDNVAVIASNWGQKRHPAWYHNLRAHPEAEVSIRGRRSRVRAEEVQGEQRDRIWQQALRVYPGFDQYARRSGERDIKVFELQPR